MSDAASIWDWIAIGLMLGGAFFSLVAGIGLLRFPGTLSRLHTAAKPQVLGLLLVLVGVAMRLRTGSDAATLLVIAVFQLVTAPTAAHMVARVTYRNVRRDPTELLVDEYKERHRGRD